MIERRLAIPAQQAAKIDDALADRDRQLARNRSSARATRASSNLTLVCLSLNRVCSSCKSNVAAPRSTALTNVPLPGAVLMTP